VQHESLKFGDEVGDESIGDWERVASKAEQWRQYGEWVEYRDSITGTVFYVNTEGRHGGECVTSVSVSRVVSWVASFYFNFEMFNPELSSSMGVVMLLFSLRYLTFWLNFLIALVELDCTCWTWLHLLNFFFGKYILENIHILFWTLWNFCETYWETYWEHFLGTYILFKVEVGKNQWTLFERNVGNTGVSFFVFLFFLFVLPYL
jgi:hypothetical protein